MTYIFDTSSFRVLDHYFPTRFPTFWEEFDRLVLSEQIVSVREVRRELESQSIRPHLDQWVRDNRHIFLLPEADETEFVAEIFSVPHFQQLVNKRNRLRGSPVADPFIIASAYLREGCVVTEEAYKPNAARIPNVCEHFGVRCVSLEQLMEEKGWAF